MNDVHPTAIVAPNVTLGSGNVILPYSVLMGPLDLGNGNIIGPHVVIGSPAANTRDPWHDASERRIEIGDRNIIREFTAVQKPCHGDMTCLGNDIFVMQGVHIAHDVIIEDKVVVTALVSLGGATRLMEGANLGQGANVHQHSVIGPYAMVASGATVVKNVKPFALCIPGKAARVNTYAVKKFGFENFADEIRRYVVEDVPPSSPPITAIVERYEKYHRASGRAHY